MPVTVVEAHQSRKIGPDWREYVYIVTGTDDELSAQNAASAQRLQYITIPNPNRNSPSDPLMITLRQRVTASQEIAGSDVDKHTWLATMRYEPMDAPDDDTAPLNYSISITANTANVKVALEQTKRLASGESDPGDFGNWIGVVRNGAGFDVQGVDCIFPQATLEIERRYSRGSWNSKVKQIIAKVGMVNSGSFEGFGEEEVLFAGARVTKGREYVNANYQFLISQTENVDIPGIGTVSKKGWRYIWVYSRLDDARGIGTKPVSAYVARVYKKTSFSSVL